MSRRMTAMQRRRQLIEVAVKLVEETGLGSLTMRDVAKNAGVSLGTLQHFFNTKDELVRSVALEFVGHVAEVAGHLPPARAGAQGKEGLERLLSEAIDTWWSAISSTPERRLATYELATSAVRSGGGLLAAALEQYELNTDFVTQLVAAAGQAAGVSWSVPVEEVGLFAITTMDGYVLRWLLEPESELLDAQRALLVRAVVGYAVG